MTVYINLQPAGRFCGEVASANSWPQSIMQPAVCLHKCSRQVHVRLTAKSMQGRNVLGGSKSLIDYLISANNVVKHLNLLTTY